MPTTPISLPPKIRISIYLVLSVATVAADGWVSTFGHGHAVDFAEYALHGLTALFLGIAASNVSKTKDAPVDASVAPAEASSASSSTVTPNDLAASFYDAAGQPLAAATPAAPALDPSTSGSHPQQVASPQVDPAPAVAAPASTGTPADPSA